MVEKPSQNDNRPRGNSSVSDLASRDHRGVNEKSEETPSFESIKSSLSGKLNFGGISNNNNNMSGQSKAQRASSIANKTRESKFSFLNSQLSSTESGESLAASQNSGNEPLSSSSSKHEPEVPFSSPDKFHTINVSKMQRDRKMEERKAMLNAALSSQSVNTSGSSPSNYNKGQAPPVPEHGPRTIQEESSHPPLPSKPPSVHRSNSHITGRSSGSKSSSRPGNFFLFHLGTNQDASFLFEDISLIIDIFDFL